MVSGLIRSRESSSFGYNERQSDGQQLSQREVSKTIQTNMNRPEVEYIKE